MIKFSQLKESAFAVRDEMEAEASTAIVDTSATDSETIEENTVHLKPHGGKGTHYQVVKGVKGHLEAGEVIHDSEVDDLHDMGYKVKHLKEDGTEVAEEGEAPLEINEQHLSKDEALGLIKGTHVRNRYNAIVKKGSYQDTSETGGQLPGTIRPAKKTVKEENEGQLSEADWKIGAAADKGLTKEEEIAVAKGTRYGDYKGHRAEMKKKHNINEDNVEQIDELSSSTLSSYVKKSGRDIGKLGTKKTEVALKHSSKDHNGYSIYHKRSDGSLEAEHNPEYQAINQKQQRRADGQSLARKKVAAAGLRVPATK